MTVGAAAGLSPVRELLLSTVENARKAALMLSPDEMWTCSDADVEALLTLHAQLESVTAAIGHLIVRDADVRDLAGTAGMTSTRQWLAAKLTITPGEAKARVKTADMLSRAAKATHAALIAGRVNPEQARTIATGLEQIEPVASAEEFADAEAFFRTEGIGLHAGHIRRLADHLLATLDPDGTEPAEKARRSRGVTITDLGGGQHRIRGIFTAECAALIKAAVDPLAAPKPAVKSPDGGVREKDPRTPAQRTHDAIADVVRQYLRHGDTGSSHGVRPHLTVTATIQTYQGDSGHPFARTATGKDLDQATLRRLACDAGMTPVLINALGVPLDVGRERRIVTPAIWKALVARDIGCIGEGCTRPASWCEAHHFPPWEDGGITSVDTCALLCSDEHHRVHHDGWEVRLGPDGHPEMIPPPWIDPDQRPRHNAHWKLVRDGLATAAHYPPATPEPEPADPDRGP
jgi:hypothetical protein